MAGYIDKKTAALADTVYDDGKLVARDVAFELPGIVFKTIDIQAMGDMTIPLIGLLEDMELTITKIGMDLGLGKLMELRRKVLEFRWVQTAVNASGQAYPEGCKAFVTCIPKSLPGLGVNPGDETEAEITYAVSCLVLYCAGREYLLVDRIANKLRVNGKDYSLDLNRLL